MDLLTPSARQAADAAERVARESYGRLVAFLAASSRDIAAAEDALADAFAAALKEWPMSGVPKNPAGWLIVAARRRLVDAARRRRAAGAVSDDLSLIGEELQSAPDQEQAIPDRRLALMFACAHPAIDPAIRAPLMLQTILGLDAAAIGSAFLVAPATMGQRLSRAKAKIRLAGVPFRIPERAELPERLDAVLDAIYAAFAHGWAEAFGEDPRGRNLAQEAIWLARVVVALAPDEPEGLGLLALMLFAEARREARRGDDGRYIPLSEQDAKLWDGEAIDEAEALLRRAATFAAPGRFQLEAAIQSAHVARRHGAKTDWPAIAWLYQRLGELTRSPVVAVNHAVALGQAQSPEAGLARLREVEANGGLETFQSFWAAKADLCARAGRGEEAYAAYERAIGLENDAAVRAFLMERRARLVN